MCSIGEDDFGDEGGLHAMIKDNSNELSNIAEFYDSDEKEISFEEIGLSTNDIKIKNVRKIVKLNLKIKRLPKKKNDFKGDKKLSNIEINFNKPSTSNNSVGHDNSSFERPNEKSNPEPIPKLCNGDSCTATDQIMSAIEELRDLVKKSCNETRDIRKEILGIKETVVNDNPSYVPFMRGPCQTLDDLTLLEYRVQEDETSKQALVKVLNKIPFDKLERYVNCCLRSIIGEKVAVLCTWHGKKGNENLSVHDMVIMKVICDCTRKKFPTASTLLIVKLMRKWFHGSKERWRKSMESKKRLADDSEILDHL